MAILSKECKTDDKFESRNSIKLAFMTIKGLPSNFFKCESFLESKSRDIFALCERNLDDSVDSGNFSVRGYLSFIQKDSTAHMHGLLVYVEERFPFTKDLYLENSILTYIFNWLYFTQCLACFSSADHLLRLYARFLILFRLT